MEKFILNITASSGEFFQGECESLTLPTADGQYGVQAGHSPVLVALEMGIMQFTVNGETRNVLVGDGIAEVTPAYVMLLVDSAERPEDIDKNRAEAARIRAEERLQHKQSMHEYYQSKIALDRAMQRLQTAAKYKRRCHRAEVKLSCFGIIAVKTYVSVVNRAKLSRKIVVSEKHFAAAVHACGSCLQEVSHIVYRPVKRGHSEVKSLNNVLVYHNAREMYGVRQCVKLFGVAVSV